MFGTQWTDNYRDAQGTFDPMLVDDDVLGALIVNRDEFALSIFMKRHKGWMHSKALKAFGFSEESDYVVANTYKAIWDSAPKFDPNKGNFRMFAAGLVKSVIRDLAHKGSRNMRLRPWCYQCDFVRGVIKTHSPRTSSYGSMMNPPNPCSSLFAMRHPKQ